jgi:hypothetical protein
LADGEVAVDVDEDAEVGFEGVAVECPAGEFVAPEGLDGADGSEAVGDGVVEGEAGDGGQGAGDVVGVEGEGVGVGGG